MSLWTRRFGFCWLSCVCATAFMLACGSDTASHEDEEDDIAGIDGGGNGSGSNSQQQIDYEVDYRLPSTPIIVDNFRYPRHDMTYTRIRFGSVIWLGENAQSESNVSALTMCYNNNSENCETYGRLYNREASSACPSGYKIPSQEDWKYAWKYREKYPELADYLKFPLGGYCDYKTYSLKDQEGVYHAGSQAVFIKNNTLTFKDKVSDGFYSLRCMRYTYIVSTVADLPKCDAANYQSERWFVMKERSNFRCMNNHWSNIYDNDCSHVDEDISGFYNDTMYVCENEKWKLGSLSNSIYECSDENDSTTILFNGVGYSCERGGWKEFDGVESILGFCKNSMRGKIDTIHYQTVLYDDNGNRVEQRIMVCDTAGWRDALVRDLYGICDSSRIYEVTTYKKKKYGCRGNGWKMFSDIENNIGLCSPSKYGTLDTIDQVDIFYCDSTGWHVADTLEITGKCTAERNLDTVNVRGIVYVCHNPTWEKFSNIEKELGFCTAAKEGQFDTTKKESLYICENGKWRYALAEDVAGKCDASKLYQIAELAGQKYYCDTDSSWESMNEIESEAGICHEGNIGNVGKVNKSYYQCTSSNWSTITELEYYMGGKCTDEKAGIIGTYNGVAYKCESKRWNKQSIEVAFGTCDSTTRGDTVTYDATHYVCQKSGWRAFTSLDERLGVCSDQILRKIVENNGTHYTCTKNGWNLSSKAEVGLGECTKKEIRELDPGEFYECSTDDYQWHWVNRIEYVYGECSGAISSTKVYLFEGVEYVCDTASFYKTNRARWRQLETLDSISGYCGNHRLGDTMTVDTSRYLCKKKVAPEDYPPEWSCSWQKVGLVEYMGECTAAREGDKIFNGYNVSECTNGSWRGIIDEYMTDSRDSKKYRIMTINGVTWMFDNLDYAGDNTSTCPGGTGTNCPKGRMYSFSSAKNICPEGWVLPDSSQWKEMEDFFRHLDWYTPGIYYGFGTPVTGTTVSYLQNGVDPMTETVNETSSAYYWYADGNVNIFGDTKFATRSSNYTNLTILEASVRCIKE